MDRLLVTGGTPLDGTVEVAGAKNSALKLMAAAVLADGRFTLRNVPRIQDCITMVETGEIWTHEERRRRAGQYRRRRQARSLRLERERAAQRTRGGGKAAQRRKRETIERAMRRARERLHKS